jgi:hypothetical protein
MTINAPTTQLNKQNNTSTVEAPEDLILTKSHLCSWEFKSPWIASYYSRELPYSFANNFTHVYISKPYM